MNNMNRKIFWFNKKALVVSVAVLAQLLLGTAVVNRKTYDVVKADNPRNPLPKEKYDLSKKEHAEMYLNNLETGMLSFLAQVNSNLVNVKAVMAGGEQITVQDFLELKYSKADEVAFKQNNVGAVPTGYHVPLSFGGQGVGRLEDGGKMSLYKYNPGLGAAGAAGHIVNSIMGESTALQDYNQYFKLVGRAWYRHVLLQRIGDVVLSTLVKDHDALVENIRRNKDSISKIKQLDGTKNDSDQFLIYTFMALRAAGKSLSLESIVNAEHDKVMQTLGSNMLGRTLFKKALGKNDTLADVLKGYLESTKQKIVRDIENGMRGQEFDVAQYDDNNSSHRTDVNLSLTGGAGSPISSDYVYCCAAAADADLVRIFTDYGIVDGGLVDSKIKTNPNMQRAPFPQSRSFVELHSDANGFIQKTLFRTMAANTFYLKLLSELKAKGFLNNDYQDFSRVKNIISGYYQELQTVENMDTGRKLSGYSDKRLNPLRASNFANFPLLGAKLADLASYDLKQVGVGAPPVGGPGMPMPPMPPMAPVMNNYQVEMALPAQQQRLSNPATATGIYDPFFASYTVLDKDKFKAHNFLSLFNNLYNAYAAAEPGFGQGQMKPISGLRTDPSISFDLAANTTFSSSVRGVPYYLPAFLPLNFGANYQSLNNLAQKNNNLAEGYPMPLNAFNSYKASPLFISDQYLSHLGRVLGETGAEATTTIPQNTATANITHGLVGYHPGSQYRLSMLNIGRGDPGYNVKINNPSFSLYKGKHPFYVNVTNNNKNSIFSSGQLAGLNVLYDKTINENLLGASNIKVSVRVKGANQGAQNFSTGYNNKVPLLSVAGAGSLIGIRSSLLNAVLEVAGLGNGIFARYNEGLNDFFAGSKGGTNPQVTSFSGGSANADVKAWFKNNYFIDGSECVYVPYFKPSLAWTIPYASFDKSSLSKKYAFEKLLKELNAIVIQNVNSIALGKYGGPYAPKGGDEGDKKDLIEGAYITKRSLEGLCDVLEGACHTGKYRKSIVFSGDFGAAVHNFLLLYRTILRNLPAEAFISDGDDSFSKDAALSEISERLKKIISGSSRDRYDVPQREQEKINEMIAKVSDPGQKFDSDDYLKNWYTFFYLKPYELDKLVQGRNGYSDMTEFSNVLSWIKESGKANEKILEYTKEKVEDKINIYSQRHEWRLRKTLSDIAVKMQKNDKKLYDEGLRVIKKEMKEKGSGDQNKLLYKYKMQIKDVKIVQFSSFSELKSYVVNLDELYDQAKKVLDTGKEATLELEDSDDEFDDAGSLINTAYTKRYKALMRAFSERMKDIVKDVLESLNSIEKVKENIEKKDENITLFSKEVDNAKVKYARNIYKLFNYFIGLDYKMLLNFVHLIDKSNFKFEHISKLKEHLFNLRKLQSRVPYLLNKTSGANADFNNLFEEYRIELDKYNEEKKVLSAIKKEIGHIRSILRFEKERNGNKMQVKGAMKLLNKVLATGSALTNINRIAFPQLYSISDFDIAKDESKFVNKDVEAVNERVKINPDQDVFANFSSLLTNFLNEKTQKAYASYCIDLAHREGKVVEKNLLSMLDRKDKNLTAAFDKISSKENEENKKDENEEEKDKKALKNKKEDEEKDEEEKKAKEDKEKEEKEKKAKEEKEKEENIVKYDEAFAMHDKTAVSTDLKVKNVEIDRKNLTISFDVDYKGLPQGWGIFVSVLGEGDHPEAQYEADAVLKNGVLRVENLKLRTSDNGFTIHAYKHNLAESKGAHIMKEENFLGFLSLPAHMIDENTEGAKRVKNEKSGTHEMFYKLIGDSYYYFIPKSATPKTEYVMAVFAGKGTKEMGLVDTHRPTASNSKGLYFSIPKNKVDRIESGDMSIHFFDRVQEEKDFLFYLKPAEGETVVEASKKEEDEKSEKIVSASKKELAKDKKEEEEDEDQPEIEDEKVKVSSKKDKKENEEEEEETEEESVSEEKTKKKDDGIYHGDEVDEEKLKNKKRSNRFYDDDEYGDGYDTGLEDEDDDEIDELPGDELYY